MYEVSREFEFSYTHRLWRYDGKCGNLHGHNGVVRVTLAQESLDESGLSVDFHQMKHTIESWVEENWDHKTILNSADPLLPILVKAGVDGFQLDEYNFWKHSCACQHCRAEFHRATGCYLPMNELDPSLNNPDSELWRRWVIWQDAGCWMISIGSSTVMT